MFEVKFKFGEVAIFLQIRVIIKTIKLIIIDII